MCTCSPESHHIWIASKAMCPAGQGRGFCPSLSWDPPGVPCSSLEFLAQIGHGPVETSPEKSHNSGQGDETPLSWSFPERVRGCLAWRESSKETLLWFFSTRKRPIKEMKINFLSGPVATGQEIIV